MLPCLEGDYEVTNLLNWFHLCEIWPLGSWLHLSILLSSMHYRIILSLRSFWGLLLMVGSIVTMVSFQKKLYSLWVKHSLRGSSVKAGNLKDRLDLQIAAIFLRVNSLDCRHWYHNLNRSSLSWFELNSQMCWLMIGPVKDLFSRRVASNISAYYKANFIPI